MKKIYFLIQDFLVPCVFAIFAVIFAVLTYWVTKSLPSSSIAAAVIALFAIPIQGTLDLKRKIEFEWWKIRREACVKALNVIDDAYSVHGWVGVQALLSKTIKNTTQLTIEAREAYEQLSCSCVNPTTLDTFLNCLFDEGKDKTVKLNKFRNATREELGLDKLEFNENWTFIGRIKGND
jgi:hypothetical protein